MVASPCASITRYAEQDFDIRVEGDGLRPVIPSCEIEVVLRAASGYKALDATIVIVVLDHDDVKIDSSGEHRSISGVGIWTLWGGRQDPLFASTILVCIHESTQLVSECGHVGHGRLEVKIEPISILAGF